MDCTQKRVLPKLWKIDFRASQVFLQVNLKAQTYNLVAYVFDLLLTHANSGCNDIINNCS